MRPSFTTTAPTIGLGDAVPRPSLARRRASSMYFRSSAVHCCGTPWDNKNTPNPSSSGRSESEHPAGALPGVAPSPIRTIPSALDSHQIVSRLRLVGLAEPACGPHHHRSGIVPACSSETGGTHPAPKVGCEVFLNLSIPLPRRACKEERLGKKLKDRRGTCPFPRGRLPSGRQRPGKKPRQSHAASYPRPGA